MHHEKGQQLSLFRFSALSDPHPSAHPEPSHHQHNTPYMSYVPSHTPSPPLLLRQMLQAWLQSLCTSASTNTPALRLPLYDFLETVTYYPPGEPVSDSAGGAAAAAPAPAATATPAAYTSNEVPYATATPYAQPMDPAGASLPLPQPPHEPARASDGWAVPVESREASDVKLAMSGPDSYGRLVAAKAAAALREGTGATSDDLRAVWELSDIDKDGMLDRDEVGANRGVGVGMPVWTEIVVGVWVGV